MAASTAPMSIQERIKAMNKVIANDVVDGDGDGATEKNNDHRSSSPSTPYTVGGPVAASSSSSSASPAGPTSAGTGAATTGGSAKRSSVIEIWKKREGSINKSLVTTNTNSRKSTSPSPSPPPSQKLHFDEKFEEKKEETDVNAVVVPNNKGFNHAVVVTPERSSNGPDPAPVVVPAPRRSSVRDSWKKRAVTLQQQSSFLPAGSKVPSRDSGGDDDATGGQRPVVIQPEPFVSKVQRPTEERKYNTATHNKMITPEKTSDSPKGSGRKSSSSPPPQGTTSAGAFDELKSKWAKFGVQNLDNDEEEKNDSQPIPTTPRSPSSAVTPSLKEPHSSSASQNVSDQENASPRTGSTGRVQSTMVQQTPLAGGFLKRRTELPPQSDGSPSGCSPVILPPNKNNTTTTKNQNHFVKLGQKHTSRSRNDVVKNPTQEQARGDGDVGGETITAKPTTPTSPRRNASSIVICGATKKALMARRMRSKQRAAMDATVNNTSKKTSDSSNAPPTPTKENGGDGGSVTMDLKQTISSGSKGGNSARTYDRVEPPESPFSTAFERDFTLSISNSDSEDQPVSLAKSSTSMEPEPCFDDWSGFPDDEGPSTIATRSSENSVQKSDSAISQELSSEKSVQPDSSVLTSRANRLLRENRQNEVEVVQHEQKGDDVAEHQSEDSGQAKPGRDSEDIPARVLEIEEEPKESQTPLQTPMYAPTQFDNTGHSDEVFSDGENDENSTIASDAGSSVMQSTFASGMTSEFTEPKRKRRGRYSLIDVVSNPNDAVPDKFVAEKNASVASFAHAYEKITFSQLAFDIGEEASSALDMEFWSKGMQTAGDTINKLVGNDLFPTANNTTKPKPPPLNTVYSGEEVAVEVEFIADSD